MAIGLPLCPRFHESTNKTIKIAKWKLRLEKLRQSKAVTVKQLESLLKEAKSQVVQEDADCRKEALIVEEQYQRCKEWLEKFDSMEDYNDLEAVQTIIDEANNSLGFILEEFTQLKDDHYESLKQIKEGFDVVFATSDRSNDLTNSGETNKRMATQDSLSNLIQLKQEMADNEDDESDQINKNSNMQPSAAAAEGAITLDQKITDGDLFDCRGNDIELL